MQTFITHPLSDDVRMTAFQLDWKRLGKQRVEAKQIILALTTGQGWIHHPATKMWTDHVPALAEYGRAMCQEWAERGYDDGLYDFFMKYRKRSFEWPDWSDDERLIDSHRSNLVHKLPGFYRQHWPEFEHQPLRPYLWPAPGVRGGLFISRAQMRRDDWELPDDQKVDPTTREVTFCA